MYKSILKFFCEYLYCGVSLDEVNQNIGHIANNIELATCFIYHGGSIYDTPYWDYAKNISKEKLLEIPVAEEMQLGITNGLALNNFIPVSMFLSSSTKAIVFVIRLFS